MKLKRVLIFCGSTFDLPTVLQVCEGCYEGRLEISIDIISCHRNPLELMQFARELKDGEYNLIICAGGKAFALPGVLDAWLHFFGKKTQVAGVALGDPGSNALSAAVLSITEIPGQPVVFWEDESGVPSGSAGLRVILNAVCEGNIPPPKLRIEKPVQIGVYRNY